ncbi:MAG: aspartyl protease family protein [Myxococcota bacterium]
MGRGAALLLIIAVPPTLLAFSAMLGLATLREVPALLAVGSAAFLVFTPPVMAGLRLPRHRAASVGLGALLWSLGLLTVLPVYFPQERQLATSFGLGMLLAPFGISGIKATLEDLVPPDPGLSTPPPRNDVVPPPHVTPDPLLADDEIALPVEGHGQRLAVPVVFEHRGRSIETYMMLDTGATYSTLPLAALQQLRATPDSDAPELTLNTANGAREAQVVLLDKVWLGDFGTEHVAITTCEDCAMDDTLGLLGLNVSGGFNLTIDPDRQEAVFKRRERHDRRLDIRPFVDLGPRVRTHTSGNVEFLFDLHNRSYVGITNVGVQVRCRDEAWVLPLGYLKARSMETRRHLLPDHTACAADQYRVKLADSYW